MIGPRDILLGALLPALVCAILLILAWLPWRRGAEPRPWAAPLAVGGAFIVALVAALHTPAFPPADSVDWIVYAAPLLALAGLLDARLRAPAIVRWLLAWAISAVLIWLVIRPLVPSRQGIAWAAGLGAATTIVWMLTEALCRRGGGEIIILLCAMSAATGPMLAMSGSLELGQIAGMLAAPIWAAAIIALWAGRPALLGGVAALFAPILLTLIIYSSTDFDASLSRTNELLLTAPAILIWIACIPILNRYRWRRWGAALLLTLLPLAIATVPTAIAFAHSMAESGE